MLFPVVVEIEFPESGGFFLQGEFWEPLHILAGYRIWCGVRPGDESDFVNDAGRKEINFRLALQNSDGTCTLYLPRLRLRQPGE